MIRLAVFDLDGTLLDTTEGILSSVEYAVCKLGLRRLTHEELLTFIGPPVQDSLARYYGLEGDELQVAATLFREDYKSRTLLQAKPYAGIYDLLGALSARGIKTAVATYKREDYALELLNHFGFGDYMEIMHGADHENKLRKSDIILKCMDRAGIDERSEVVMIGDTHHDAKGAATLGVDFIAVTYGFGFKPEAEECDCRGYAHAPMEILNYI